MGDPPRSEDPAFDQSAEVDAIELVHPSTPMDDAPYEPAEKPDPSEYLEDERRAA